MGPALAGSDPDAGSVLAYIITGGNTGSAFGVNQLTGMLFVASPVDFETQTSYSLSLRVQDGGGLSQDATVTVTVTSDGAQQRGADLLGAARSPYAATLAQVESVSQHEIFIC